MSVVTLYYKDKVYEEGSIPPEGKSVGDPVAPASIEVLDWHVQGGAFLGVLAPNVVSVFPLHNLEAAVVILSEEGEDAEEGAEVPDEASADAGTESGDESDTGPLFVADFGGSVSDDEGVEGAGRD